LIDLLLGRIFLVSGSHLEAMEIARELPPGYSVVTTDGLLILAGGLIKSPSIAGEELLKRRLEVKEIKDQIEISAGLLRKNSEDSEMFEAHSRELAAEIQLLREGYEEKLAELRGVERSLFENEHSLAASEKELKAAVRGQEILEEEITALEERINVVEVRIEANKEQTERLESSIELAEVELRALPASEIADERRHLQQNIETTKTIVAGRQAVVDSRRATLVQIDEQLDRIGQRIEDLRSREVDLELAEKQAEANNHQKTMEDIDAELKPLQMSLKERRDEITVMEKKLSEQLMKNQAAEKRYVQARVTLNQADNRIEGLKERISADLGLVALRYDEDEIAQSPLPMKDVVDQLPAVEELPQDIEKTIQRLRGQLHRMGGINPDAPAEYDETRKRHDFLKQQVVDLTATIEQLQGVIVELDELTSKVFVETVQKVDENFGEVFRRLFGGGTGRLVLTDPDDLITTGVDIVARLPNRREQALGLLSGGERSLTATALIFSLLMVSPTPFCVLDEVDAMLDEANVNRFREMLQELSEETQFIIITHNRGTVQVAESVYGVSMGADSASQVISIKPEEYVTFSGVR
jgi:chromosome segregation protein